MKACAPCKDCSDRVLGCHSGCSRYQDWHKAYREEGDIIRRAKYLETLLVSPTSPACKKSLKYAAR